MVVKDAGRSEILLEMGDESRSHPILRPIPLFWLVGCWNSEIPVPWKEPVQNVELGLWSMLSTAAVVNNPYLNVVGHITSSVIQLTCMVTYCCGDVPCSVIYH